MEEKVVKTQPVKESSSGLVIGIMLVLACLGVGVGYLLSKSHKTTTQTTTSSQGEMIKTDNEVGSTDTKVYRDTATGTLEAGGLNNEGTHKLIRDGGPSQTVYLISSVVDLDQFVGKKVEIWGETHRASKVSWLMDVGRVKLVE